MKLQIHFDRLYEYVDNSFEKEKSAVRYAKHLQISTHNYKSLLLATWFYHEVDTQAI